MTVLYTVCICDVQNQLRAVTRRLSSKIQQNQSAYLKHLAEIEMLHDQLCDARDYLSECRQRVTALKAISKVPLEMAVTSRQASKLKGTGFQIRTEP